VACTPSAAGGGATVLLQRGLKCRRKLKFPTLSRANSTMGKPNGCASQGARSVPQGLRRALPGSLCICRAKSPVTLKTQSAPRLFPTRAESQGNLDGGLLWLIFQS
jgi:hypothetical protein